ncbi:hypothetical protein WJX74_007352 [Apatococcus lobatus]|uniref:Uncharacterized protein n=2 Tax=Apatococcus TaxID=904362 RepID=A0AAW1RQK6_9CHLO
MHVSSAGRWRQLPLAGQQQSSNVQQSTSFGEAAIQGLEAWQHQKLVDRVLKKCCCTVAEVSPLVGHA